LGAAHRTNSTAPLEVVRTLFVDQVMLLVWLAFQWETRQPSGVVVSPG
jgi:hypothetical protein